MRIRTQLALISIPVLLAPFLVVGLWVALAMPRASISPQAATRRDAWYRELGASTSSLDSFLAAGRKGQAWMTAVFVGKDGELLLELGDRELAASAWKMQSGLGAGDGELSTMRIGAYAVQGYGTVRVLEPAFPPPELGGSVNPLFVAAFFLAVTLGIGSLTVSRSLRATFSGLESSAGRLCSGDFETPVALPRHGEATNLALALEGLRKELLEERARRSRFIMGLSHDFRTPVGLIRGYAEAMLDGMVTDPEKGQRYLALIRDKSFQIDELVESLLEYLRTETDQRREAMVTRDLRAFFDSLAREFEEDATLQGRRFVFKSAVSAPVLAPLDERLARRAFENLFSNALRYTEKGGSILLETELVAGDRFVASLVDDGIGIDPDEAQRLFDPLFRGSNVGKRKGQGMGLAIVKSVIEGLGWSIACMPNRDKGTRFSIAIPLERGNPG